MSRPAHPSRRLPRLALLVAAIGATLAAGVGAAAAARAFTLAVTKNASVTNQKGAVKHEAIVTAAGGFAVYWLTGDSTRHPKCTAKNTCFHFWPPVTVASARKLSKNPAIKGKLTTWRRSGLTQVVLGGHPLYFFSFDGHKGAATGEGIVSFGGTWHVIPVAGAPHKSAPMPAPAQTTSTVPYY